MNNPTVSVIIPTHNHAHFLTRTLESVKKQTYDNYEVILVDNGSTDSTKELINEFKWDKLLYFYQNDTGSAAGPRNTGIRLSRGKYIAFLDSDDIWYETKLEKVMGIFTKYPEIDLVCNDEYMKKGDQIVTYLKNGPAEENMYEKLLFFGNRLSGSATVVKKESIIKANCFDLSKKFIHVEDYDLWLKLAKLGYKFFFLNEPLGEYILHDNNLSYDTATHMRNFRNVIYSHFINYDKKNRPIYMYLFIKAYFQSYYNQLLRYKQNWRERKNKKQLIK